MTTDDIVIAMGKFYRTRASAVAMCARIANETGDPTVVMCDLGGQRYWLSQNVLDLDGGIFIAKCQYRR